MSIIKKHRESRGNSFYSIGSNKDVKGQRAEPKILDLAKFKQLVDDVCEFHKTTEKSVDKNRKRTYIQSWRLGQLVGYVDKPTFVMMIERMIEHVISAAEAVQVNGKWQLYGWEYSIEEKVFNRKRTVGKDKDGNFETVDLAKSETYFLLGVEIVDVNGGKDVLYEMGHPVPNRQNGIDNETIVKLLQNQGVKASPGSIPSDEHIKTIETQKETIAKQDEKIASLEQSVSSMQEMMQQMLELQKSNMSAPVEPPSKGSSKRGKK